MTDAALPVTFHIDLLPNDSEAAQTHREQVHGGHHLGGLEVFALWRDGAWAVGDDDLVCRLCAGRDLAAAMAACSRWYREGCPGDTGGGVRVEVAPQEPATLLLKADTP